MKVSEGMGAVQQRADTAEQDIVQVQKRVDDVEATIPFCFSLSGQLTREASTHPFAARRGYEMATIQDRAELQLQ